MKKVLLAVVIMLAGFIGAYAQPTEGISFGAGVRLSLPIGDLADVTSFGIGGEVQAEYGFSESASAVFTTGYTSFLAKSYDVPGFGSVKGDAVGYIPFLVGARYYPSGNFFIGGQIGYGLLTGNGSSDGAFNYQPQVGYNASKFQLALGYNGLSKDGTTFSHIGLSGIFKFGGSK